MRSFAIAAGVSVALVTGCSMLDTQSTESQPYSYQATSNWAAAADPLVQTGVLENGLTWYTKALPDNGARDRVELRLRIRAGSLQETDEELGLAHFVEHMAFNGTERFPKQAIVEFFESAGMTFGGDINAHTSFDETVYKLTLPADKPELIETGMEVLYDWATAISFTDEEVAKEAPVVIEEWRSSYGTEEQSWLQEYIDVYQGTRLLNRLPIGDPEIVQTATAEQLSGYYSKWYRPDNAEVVIVYPEGALDAVNEIKTIFTPWQAEATPAVDYDIGTVTIETPKFKAVTDSNITSHEWQLYFPLQGYDSQTSVGREVDFVDQIITSVLSSRLQRLGEQESAPIIDASISTDSFFDDSKNLTLWASIYEGESDAALSQLIQEMNRLRAHGITEAEFAKAKKKLLVQYQNISSWLQGASSADHADYLLYFLAEELPLEDIDAALLEAEVMAEQISLAKVNEYIEQLLASERVAGYFYHPKTFTPNADAWQNTYDAAWAASVDPVEEKAQVSSDLSYVFEGEISQQADLVAEEGLYIWVLENGIPVVLKQTDLEPGRVNVQSLVFGGSRQLTDDLIPASEQWREVRIRSGMEGLSGQDFIDSLEIDGIGYDVFLSDGYTGADLSGPSEQLQRMMQLTVGTFVETAFDESMIALTLNSSSEQADQFAQTPDYDYLTQYLPAVYADDERYKIFTGDEVSAINLEKLQRVQESILNANQGMVIAIVGDVSPADVTPLLRLHVAGVPLAEPAASLSVGSVMPQSEIIRVAGQADEKADIRYVYSQAELPATADRFLTSEVMIQALDKRLHNAIREDSGLTYGTHVFQRPQYYFEQQWLLHVRMSTDPEREQEALDALDSTLAKVLDEPFTAEEVEQAVLRVIEQYKQAHSTNEGIINELTDILLLGSPFTEYDNYTETLELVTADSVNELAALLLTGKKVVAVHHP